jgi:hypothetical protein
MSKQSKSRSKKFRIAWKVPALKYNGHGAWLSSEDGFDPEEMLESYKQEARRKDPEFGIEYYLEWKK